MKMKKILWVVLLCICFVLVACGKSKNRSIEISEEGQEESCSDTKESACTDEIATGLDLFVNEEVLNYYSGIEVTAPIELTLFNEEVKLGTTVYNKISDYLEYKNDMDFEKDICEVFVLSDFDRYEDVFYLKDAIADGPVISIKLVSPKHNEITSVKDSIISAVAIDMSKIADCVKLNGRELKASNLYSDMCTALGVSADDHSEPVMFSSKQNPGVIVTSKENRLILEYVADYRTAVEKYIESNPMSFEQQEIAEWHKFQLGSDVYEVPMTLSAFLDRNNVYVRGWYPLSYSLDAMIYVGSGAYYDTTLYYKSVMPDASDAIITSMTIREGSSINCPGTNTFYNGIQFGKSLEDVAEMLNSSLKGDERIIPSTTDYKRVFGFGNDEFGIPKKKFAITGANSKVNPIVQIDISVSE